MNRSQPHPLGRRDFLKRTVAVAATTALCRAPEVYGAHPNRIVDVNVHLSRWPTRRLPSDTIEALIERLRASGVVEAWAGSFDALLHKDLRTLNRRIAQQCRRHGHGLLLPVGTVNPALPDWEEDLDQCIKTHEMRVIRLFPNYHGYTLDSPEFARLARAASAHRVVVQIAAIMEDERMMHRQFRVEPVDLAPLARVVRETPGLRVVLLNAWRTVRQPLMAELFRAGEVYADISMLEGVGGLDKLLGWAPAERVLFGSHAPFFYIESAMLKLKESTLTAQQLEAIRRDNARRLL